MADNILNNSNLFVDEIDNLDYKINDINQYNQILINTRVNDVIMSLINVSNNLINYVNDYDLIVNIDDTIINSLEEEIENNSNSLIDYINSLKINPNIDNDCNILRFI